MKSWNKVASLAAASLAVIVVGAAITAGTGSAQTPSAPSGAVATAPSGAGHGNRPAIVNDNTADEAVLTPIVPCRAVDTRHGGGALTNGTTRSFLIEGSGSFTSQGGPAVGCGIPANATALAAVISAVTPNSQGYFKAFPSATTAPASSIMDYSKTITTSSGVTVAITPNTAFGLKVFNFGGPANLTLDITGYYQPQIEADIEGNGSFFGHSSRVLSVTHTAASGFYAVTTDRPVEGPCSAVATPLDNGNFATAVTEPGGVVDVRIFHLVGGVVTSGDDEFNLVVSC